MIPKFKIGQFLRFTRDSTNDNNKMGKGDSGTVQKIETSWAKPLYYLISTQNKLGIISEDGLELAVPNWRKILGVRFYD